MQQLSALLDNKRYIFHPFPPRPIPFRRSSQVSLPLVPCFTCRLDGALPVTPAYNFVRANRCMLVQWLLLFLCICVYFFVFCHPASFPLLTLSFFLISSELVFPSAQLKPNTRPLTSFIIGARLWLLASRRSCPPDLVLASWSKLPKPYHSHVSWPPTRAPPFRPPSTVSSLPSPSLQWLPPLPGSKLRASFPI